MKIAIIEDKLLNIKLLIQMLDHLGISENDISHALTVQSGIELLETKKPELLFLDIDLGLGYGFDVLNKSKYKDFELIFITAHPNYALKSYSFNPIHYLVKPYTEEELKEALRRFETRQDQPKISTHPTSPESEQNLIAFPENGRIHFVEIENIMYLESSNIYTICHLKNKKRLVVSKSIGSYKELLPESNFCRIHDRYIVNLHQISSYNKGRGGEVELKDGTLLTVAYRRKELFLKKIHLLARR